MSDDFDDLLQLVAQYGEDFTSEFTDERAAFDDFATNAVGDPRSGALEQLDRLLLGAASEAQLAERLNDLGFAYRVQSGGSNSRRDFLQRLRGWLVQSLHERPPAAG